jgi:hypothetical protein
VAYQSFARNSTLCVSGSVPASNDGAEEQQLFWDKAFLCLDGPEVWRHENVGDVAMKDKGATNDGRKRGPNRMQWQQGRVE